MISGLFSVDGDRRLCVLSFDSPVLFEQDLDEPQFIPFSFI